MTDSRALVIAQGVSGSRVSAWLARGGAAVRQLGVRAQGTSPVRMSAPCMLGQPWVLEPWAGRTVAVRPRRSLFLRGRLVAMPPRRRDLTRLAGGSLGALARDLRPRIRSPRTLGQWGHRNFGRAAWRRILRGVVSKRLGASCDHLDPGYAGLLVGPDMGADWRALAEGPASAAARRADLVLDAGGEVLDGVHIEGLEVADGRIVAVLTEFGREHVSGPLYADVRPRRLAGWLPRGVLPEHTLAILDALPVQERSVVEVQAEVTGLPWEVWVSDADVPVVRAHRPQGDGPGPRGDTVVVELERCVPDEEAAELAVRFLQGLGIEGGDTRVGRRTHVLPITDARARGALDQLWSLGVVPVGEHGSHLSVSVAQEAMLAESWSAERSPRDALDRMLTAPASSRQRELLP